MPKIEVAVTFTAKDLPEDCTLTEEQFEDWLDNAGGQLRDSLITHGNEWIATRLEIDNLMKDD